MSDLGTLAGPSNSQISSYRLGQDDFDRTSESLSSALIALSQRFCITLVEYEISMRFGAEMLLAQRWTRWSSNGKRALQYSLQRPSAIGWLLHLRQRRRSAGNSTRRESNSRSTSSILQVCRPNHAICLGANLRPRRFYNRGRASFKSIGWGRAGPMCCQRRTSESPKT